MSYARNRIKQSVTGSGTGNLTLGSAAEGFIAATAAYANNERFVALIEQDEAWEISVVYHFNSGTSLVREACIQSSNADAAVDFPAGDKTVAVVPLAPRVLASAPTSASNNLSHGFYPGSVVLAPPYSGAPAGTYRLFTCTQASTSAATWSANPQRVSGDAATEAYVLAGDMQTNTAPAAYATVINGVRNRAGAYGAAFGKGAVGYYNAALSIGGGVILNGGNFETGISAVLLSAGAATTDATATKIAFDMDHASNYGLYVDSGVLRISAKVVAFEPATGDAKEWTVEAFARMSTDYVDFDLIGTPSVSSAFASAGASAWDVAVSIDGASETLEIEVTGEAAHTIRWAATIVACSLIHYT